MKKSPPLTKHERLQQDIASLRQAYRDQQWELNTFLLEQKTNERKLFWLAPLCGFPLGFVWLYVNARKASQAIQLGYLWLCGRRLFPYLRLQRSHCLLDGRRRLYAV